MSTPPTPKSSWSRMRGVVRRASTLVVPKPPSITGPDRDTDTASIKGSVKPSSIKSIATSLLPSKVLPPQAAPSPIAESPARENDATKDDAPPAAASPLSQSQTSPPLAPDSETTQASPVGYTPPPLIDSTATGPGGFTDDVDLLPQPQVIQDPFAQQPALPGGDPSPPADDVEGVVPAPTPAVILQPEPVSIPDAATRDPVPTQPATPVQEPAILSDSPVTNEPQQLTATPDPSSYFDIPVVDEPVDILHPSITSRSAHGIQQAADEHVVGPSIVTPVEPSRELSSDDPFQPQTKAESSMPQPEHNPPGTPPSGIFPLPIPLSMPGYEPSTAHDVWGGATTKPIDGSNTRSIANGHAPQCVFLFFKGDALLMFPIIQYALLRSLCRSYSSRNYYFGS